MHIDSEFLPETQPAATPEQILWASALHLLIDDAMRYYQGRGLNGNPRDYESEAAFDDVMRCGPMLRYLCMRTGTNPAWITRKFKHLVEVRAA